MAAKVTSITETVTTYAPAATTTLNLSVYLEGMYASGELKPALKNAGKTINALMTDTITVELRQATAPYSLIESATAVLKTDGTCTLSYSASRTGNAYYIVVKHHSCIATWSKSPVTFAAVTSYSMK